MPRLLIIERVAAGASVIIGKAGKPMAVLSPYASIQKPREPGRMKGKIENAPDFDAADDQIAYLFEGDPTEAGKQ